MRIKRIEIIGFKSFCDRTVMTFHEPITGVVGPNGCGKSNVVDAIRWCMGEQSAKHLRGQSMADVIFNGSDKRGPAGMAQVSLTFEDVGFSHEMLNLAEEEGQILADPVLSDDALADVQEAEAAEAAAEMPEGEGAEAAPPIEGAQDAVPVMSATDEVREILTDAPPSIDFSKYSEVTITRRLFRDGSSGYFLNNTPCRLRDITDFFLGTGIGTKAYSIIEQGRIGMIVSSRPQERRHLIEEAAGVTKFKNKKRAAERKLEQTKHNLLRVTDIVTELDKRMGSLRRQAQKAERFRKYRSEVKDIELWKASHRYLELNAEEQVLRLSAVELREAMTNARTEFDAVDARMVAERAELSIEERRLSGLQERIFELENRIKLAESKVEYERREADELEDRVQTASGEIRSLEARRDEAQTELVAHREELTEFASRTEAAEEAARSCEVEWQEARQTLKAAQARLDEARSGVSAARTELAGADSKRESGQRRREDTERRLQRVRDELATVEARLDEVERSARTLQVEVGELRQTRLDLGQQQGELQSKRTELEERSEHCEAEVENLRTELHRRKSRLTSLREIQERYEGFAQGTRAVMQNRAQVELEGGHIRGLVADVLSAPENLETAVEAVLGDRLGGVLVEDHRVGRRAVEYLKDAAAGRSTFVPTHPVSAAAVVYEDRSTFPENTQGVIGVMTDLVKFESGYDDVGRALLSDTVVVDNLENALRMHSLGIRFNLVTLEGDMVDKSGVVTGGCRESEGSGVLSQKREIRELEEITASLESDLTDATQRFVSTKAELSATIRGLDQVRGQAHDRDLALHGKEKELTGSQGELERLRERAHRLSTERLELEGVTADLEREHGELTAKVEDVRQRISELETAQLSLVSEVTDGQAHAEKRQADLTAAKIEMAQLGQKRASLESSVLRGENTCRDLSERIVKLEASISENSQRSVELRADADEISTGLALTHAERTEQATLLSDGRNVYETRMAELEVKDHEARQLRQTADRLFQEASAAEVKLESIQVNRNHLEDTVTERYGIELKQEVGDYHLRPQVGPEDEEKLLELKRLIERMGTDINLLAIEEFEEVSKRHDFLKAQRDDLDSAVSQLEKAIFKINRTSRKLFRDTFEAINANFMEMFPRLFRGGKARLELTGGDDVDLLDAGVEIHAQPPGKKNATVDQLSGGEKALTAVSLLLSIFLVKPSPFCLLDEVDAPLDEANVDRYNEILRQMVDKSQFIIITHNKRTMGIVDRLYGVTMEEPGCSKLVSVNLNKIGENKDNKDNKESAAA